MSPLQLVSCLTYLYNYGGRSNSSSQLPAIVDFGQEMIFCVFKSPELEGNCESIRDVSKVQTHHQIQKRVGALPPSSLRLRHSLSTLTLMLAGKLLKLPCGIAHTV
jgi:hypothetical protein